MAKGPRDPRERIEALRLACAGGDAAQVTAALRGALADRHPLVVARAAALCAERGVHPLEGDLTAAYLRLTDDPVKRDPGCLAKGPIVRALVTLDCQDAGFFVAGLSYTQYEPVWGGRVDTAVDIRVSCAMGLVGTSYPRAVVELVTLLYDPEPRARGGAARAIACCEPRLAEPVLRAKALGGDGEPEVTGDCLAGLLRAAPEESVAFVAGFLAHDDPARCALAALALGESRLPAALAALRTRWDEEPLKGESERALLRGAALHRSAAAYDWLLSVVGRGDRGSALTAIDALAVYRHNAGLAARLAAAVAAREDPAITARFAASWSSEREETGPYP